MFLIKQHARWLVAGILIAFCAVSLKLASDDAVTMDERAHIPASWSYVKYLDMRVNPEHPPLLKDLAGLSMLAANPNFSFPYNSDLWKNGDTNVIPADHPEGTAKSWGLAQWEFGVKFLFGSGNNPDTIAFAARLPIILVGILLCFMVYLWTRELAGVSAGLFALLLIAADPNMLGHSHYVTTDVGIAAFIFTAAYFFVRFLKEPSGKNIVLAGIFLGIAELTKFSAVILFPLFGLIALLYAATKSQPHQEAALLPEQARSERMRKLFEYIAKYAGIVVISFVTIWALYLINVWNMPGEVTAEIARAVFPNDKLVGRIAESTVVTLSNIPALKPLAQYFLGVFMVFARVAGGNTYYFFGTVTNQATPLYFPAVFLLKETLPFLTLLFFGILYGARRMVKMSRTNREKGLTAWGIFARSFQSHIAQYVMMSFVILYAYLSIAGNLNIGFRHLFPILPFLTVLITKALFDYWKRHRGNHSTWTTVRLVVSFLVIWIALIPILNYPYYLSYFNTAAGGHENGYRYVTDSNYDWGQDAKRLQNWVADYNTCIRSNQESSASCRTLTNGKTFPTDAPIDTIRVDYFGGSDPQYYLGSIFEGWHSNNAPQPGWYAVSAGFYQESIYKPHAAGDGSYAWLPVNTMIGRAGDSIFIFYVK